MSPLSSLQDRLAETLFPQEIQAESLNLNWNYYSQKDRLSLGTAEVAQFSGLFTPVQTAGKKKEKQSYLIYKLNYRFPLGKWLRHYNLKLMAYTSWERVSAWHYFQSSETIPEKMLVVD